MRTNSQAIPHEAGSAGRFTSENAAAMGARGAAKREQNWQERISGTRQELAAHADIAVERLRAIIEEGKDADALRAAIAVLDRIGVGPHSSRDVSMGSSLVEQWAAELDAEDAA